MIFPPMHKKAGPEYFPVLLFNSVFYSTSIKRLAIKLKNGKEIYISPVKMDNVLMKIIRKVEL